jgi:hypothetical protein
VKDKVELPRSNSSSKARFIDRSLSLTRLTQRLIAMMGLLWEKL